MNEFFKDAREINIFLNREFSRLFPQFMGEGPYVRNEKMKVWAMLFGLKSQPDSIKESLMFLVSAYNLDSAIAVGNQLIQQQGKLLDDYILQQWLGSPYDELLPKLTGYARVVIPEELKQKFLERLVANFQESAKANPEKFYYNFSYLLDETEATEAERVIVGALLLRFKKKHGKDGGLPQGVERNGQGKGDGAREE